jgi:uncharacterized membrane protein YfcA
MASVAAQFVSLAGLRPRFDWPAAAPYLAGGILGVPLGVWTLTQASPETLKLCIGVFLVLYAVSQLSGLTRLSIGAWGGRSADAAVGFCGGALGGFAGLSGPLPLIWLQLRGGASLGQRAVYQPFNLLVLILATAGMATAGKIDLPILQALVIAIPATVLGSWLGTRVYSRASEATVRKVVLVLLLVSGTLLVGQTVW